MALQHFSSERMSEEAVDTELPIEVQTPFPGLLYPYLFLLLIGSLGSSLLNSASPRCHGNRLSWSNPHLHPLAQVAAEDALLHSRSAGQLRGEVHTVAGLTGELHVDWPGLSTKQPCSHGLTVSTQPSGISWLMTH